MQSAPVRKRGYIFGKQRVPHPRPRSSPCGLPLATFAIINTMWCTVRIRTYHTSNPSTGAKCLTDKLVEKDKNIERLSLQLIDLKQAYKTTTKPDLDKFLSELPAIRLKEKLDIAQKELEKEQQKLEKEEQAYLVDKAAYQARARSFEVSKHMDTVQDDLSQGIKELTSQVNTWAGKLAVSRQEKMHGLFEFFPIHPDLYVLPVHVGTIAGLHLPADLSLKRNVEHAFFSSMHGIKVKKHVQVETALGVIVKVHCVSLYPFGHS